MELGDVLKGRRALNQKRARVALGFLGAVGGGGGGHEYILLVTQVSRELVVGIKAAPSMALDTWK